MPRPTVIEVDLDAIAHNVARLAALIAPARLMSVVKANGYGHGAVPVAETALRAGAKRLGVATVEEGVELRDAGITAPILVLAEPPIDDVDEAAARDLALVVGRAEFVAAAQQSLVERADLPMLRVHVMVDTGMARMGCSEPEGPGISIAAVAADRIRVDGLCTHMARADEEDPDATERQLEAFNRFRYATPNAPASGRIHHVSNSAAAIWHPHARLDMARVGIATYGLVPSSDRRDDPTWTNLALRPALTLRTEVSAVREIGEGDGVSYGHRFVADRPMRIATLPLGYADGVPRALGTAGGHVLIGGQRCPVRGVVTMDQMMVEVPDGVAVAPGTEAVLIGEQGAEHVTATEWADLLGTINYEIVCGFGARIPRRYIGSPVHQQPSASVTAARP